ncbi:MAG: FtsX-like permease family protein [Actinobacteria bacterium]|nr:FtsX-like permease family protein [Actinomycetota bacterium]
MNLFESGLIYPLISAVLILFVAIGAFVRPAIFRIALRDFKRRPSQTTLVVIGLLIASLVIAGSLVAADSLEGLFVENVHQAWGPVDLQVGTLSGAPFQASKANAILEDPKVRSLADAGAARLEIRAAAESPTHETSEARAGLIGIDFDADEAVFGKFQPVTPLTELGANQVVINQRLADILGVSPGDPINFAAISPAGEPFVLQSTVHAVVADSEKANWKRQPNAFIRLSDLQEVARVPGQVNQVLLSAKGPPRAPRNIEALGEAAVDAAAVVEAQEPPPPPGRVNLALAVAESKGRDLDRALETSEFFRAVLVMLGAIVALTSIALIVNIFIMLGEERRQELGTMRALGLKRSGLVFLGITEGVIYSVASAIIGSLIGAFFGRFVGKAMADLFKTFSELSSVEFAEPPFELRIATLLTAAGAGFLVSVLSVAFVSYRTSRLTVVAAIRGFPEVKRRKGRRVPVIPGLSILAGLPIVLASGNVIAKALGGVVFVYGVGGIIARYWNARLGLTLGSLAGVAWGFWAHAKLNPDFDRDPGTAFAFLGSVGVVTVASGVILTSANLSLLRLFSAPFGARARAVMGTASGYASANRLKTGLSIAMFSLVLYMIAGFAVWGEFGGGDFEEQSGGWDIFVRTTLPVQELRAEGAEAQAGLFAGRYDRGYKVGQESRTDPIFFYGVGADFLDENRFKFIRKQRGLTDRQTWDQLVSVPDSVILDGITAPSGAEVGEKMIVITDRGPYELTLVGITTENILNAAFMSKETMLKLYPGRASNTVWLVRSQPGVSDRSVAQSVLRNHREAGTEARPLREIIELGAQFQRTFVGLFQLLLKMGLLIGVSGLAISAVRTVLERRHAIGILRALGFRRSMVAAWLLIESIIVATLGVLIGLGVGLLGTYLVITLQIDDYIFSVDWNQVTSTVLLIYAAVVIFTAIPALRAARLKPAEAVRYVE